MYYFKSDQLIVFTLLNRIRHTERVLSFELELPRVVKLTPQSLEDNLEYKVDKLHSTDDRESSEKSHGPTNS